MHSYALSTPFSPPALCRLGGVQVQASVNEPTFFFQHADVDRSLMHWEQWHPDTGYTLNYPTDKATTDGIAYGHRLNDVLTYFNPFYTEDLFPEGLEGGPTGAWTVADVLCYVGLETSPYTYDTVLKPAQE